MVEQVKDTTTNTVYTKKKLLGKGGFAKCFEFVDKRGCLFAGKVVSKTGMNQRSTKEKLHQEIAIHKMLSHEHIVKIISCFEDDKCVYILLELCRNKTLLELHKRRHVITEPEARYYALQIAQGCDYIHKNKVIHRDLKLANIFLNEDMRVKIGDFGLATQLTSDEDRRRTMCGTPNYIAPEILRKDGHDYAVDMWSLGCIIYTLLVGNPPFETNSLKDTYAKIKSNSYMLPPNVTVHAKTLIKAALHGEPKKRPTMETVQKYSFFLEYTPSILPVSALVATPRFDHIAANRHWQRTLNPIDNILDNPIISGMGVGSNNVTSLEEHQDNHLLEALSSQINSVLTRGKVIMERVGVAMLDLMEDSEDPNLSPLFWVSKWVDYSDRYGLGYQLCNGGNGVVFNDNSRIIVANNNVQFIEKDGKEFLYTTNDCPDKLAKKITLLNYFHTYMNENLLTTGENMINDERESMVRLPYVKAWFRTKTAIVFYLSSGTVQINMFNDHTKLILCPLMGAVTYIDHSNEFRTYKLDGLMTCGVTSELKQRLQFSIKMISQVVPSEAHKINAV